MRCTAAAAAAVAVFLCAPALGAATTYPTGFEERPLVSGLTAPTAVAWAPDGRMFVIEQAGRLKVVAPGASTATTILDISNRVNSYWDRGLLGLAVDSDFANNNYIYLLYTYELQPMTPDGQGPMVSRLGRFTVSPSNTVSAETPLLGRHTSGVCPAPANAVDCIPSEGASHSIGTVRSAPDGTLWVGSGDAASFNVVDPLAFRTYNPQSMAGKIMHVDRDGRGLPGHPFCPGNANLNDVCTKVWAGGLRNPFRFELRPGGGLTVGDVGWETTEEIDLLPTGAGGGGRLYGWPCYEGSGRTAGYRDRPECPPEYAKEGTANAHLGPAYTYPHVEAGGAVQGGPTFTSDRYPADYQGDIFVGDYAQGFVRKLNMNAQGQVASVQQFATDWFGVDLELTPIGELAYVAYGDGAARAGSVRRIVYTPNNRSPIAVLRADRTFGPAPLTVAFDGGGSHDPDGDRLTYEWDFGDGTRSTAVAPTHTYSSPGNFTAQLTVRDEFGDVDTEPIVISSDNTPPAPQITGASTYRGGETFRLQGSASDAQDGTVPASRMSWDVRIVHSGHTHVLGTFANRSELALEAITDHDADAFYRIVLTATDSGDLSAQQTAEVRPETTTVRLRSSPPGALLSYGGRELTAPRDLVTAVGYRTSISAGDPLVQNGEIFDFAGWSNGGARVQDFVVPPGGAELVANYRSRSGTSASGGTVPNGSRPPGSGSAADTVGPMLRLDGVNRARGRIRGRAIDRSGVASVQVALRRRASGGRCRWWLGRKRRLSRAPRRCGRPQWMNAQLKAADRGVRWRRALGRPLAPGTYRVLVRAGDMAGNRSTLTRGRRSLVRVKAPR